MRRRLPWKAIVGSLVEALRTSAAIFFILIAAFLFQYFLAVTQMSQLLSDLLTSLPVGPTGIVIVILAFYIVVGMFVDELAIILLTIPIVFPIVTGLGCDPVWFGVLVVVTVQIGLIAPPVGIICFIMNSMVPSIGLVEYLQGRDALRHRGYGVACAAGGVSAALAAPAQANRYSPFA